ncbi:helix-turn-helix domain-containing protein [Flavobacterium pectinovorum]|uniref:DNA-binding protein n=1 Tax=Flavobacterium pectinovorum TaxID=29533 RepID=A0AB36P5T5_9FLAO|nr:helix-turn-helix domain-containing protein [Flavobacterium pectinovorum]OXB06255.1 DNA-binding protein [Flavobacterium pectinovorum]SHM99442.1 transcriptional regulator, AraC family [Flavobacterium pectinovorum]
MDKINLLVTISIIITFIALFLSFFLLTVKTAHKLSNRLFAFFLVLTAIDISANLGDLLAISLNVRVFISSFFFLQLPVFYLYVLSVCYSDFKLKPKHLLHGLTFLIANLILLPRFYAVDLESKISFLANISSMPEVQFNHILMHIQMAFYIVGAFMILRKAKKIYLENYAGASIESLNWLFQFTIALSAFYFIALVKNIFKFTQYPNISEGLKIGLLLFELIIIFWYLFKALNNPGLFRTIDSKLKLVQHIISEGKNTTQLAINEKEHNEELLKLQQYMVEKKPFLNPSLTIQDVSAAIEIPVRNLSLLINHTLEQHFYDFVNSYRIENAMEILKDDTKSKVTILEILYDVGFNSKSSFNTAFKKHTGYTPTVYRKTL